jgi:5-methylcytosine-specific restriction endonuclease McrA
MAAKAGMTVSEYQRDKLESAAVRAGHDNVVDFLNSKHPYRKHRKDYCENRDGRLGYKCRYKIRHTAQLQVDHKNGNPDDNRPRNLQTLCANCHIYKTHENKDYSTPGRKTLKKKKGMFTSLVI